MLLLRTELKKIPALMQGHKTIFLWSVLIKQSFPITSLIQLPWSSRACSLDGFIPQNNFRKVRMISFEIRTYLNRGGGVKVFLLFFFFSWCFVILFLNSKVVSVTLLLFVFSERKKRTRWWLKNNLAKPSKFFRIMDYTAPHRNLQLCGLWQQMCLELSIWKPRAVVLFVRTVVFSWPVDPVRKKPQALVRLSACCLASCFPSCLVWKTSRLW